MKKIKQFFAYLRHLWKDPIKTVSDCDQRKKEIMPLLYVSIGILVLFVGLSLIPALDFMATIGGTIGLGGIAFCVFLISIANKAKKKFIALTCTKCNTMADLKTEEDFAKYVNYEVTSFTVSYDGVSHPGSNDGVVSYVKAQGHADAVVTIQLTCPNCGEVKTLVYTVQPFKCHREEDKVRVPDVEIVKSRLEATVTKVLETYKTEEGRKEIPFTIHSVHHSEYANRSKPQMGNSAPRVGEVIIDYHRTIPELVEGFFIHNELNGNIS